MDMPKMDSLIFKMLKNELNDSSSTLQGDTSTIFKFLCFLLQLA